MSIRPGQTHRVRRAASTWLVLGVLSAACGSETAVPVRPMRQQPIAAGKTGTPAASGGAGATAPATAAPAGGGDTAGSAGSAPAAPLRGAPLPCDVGTIVSAKCGTCHGEKPIGGAPMSLLDHDDFSAEIKSLKTEPGVMAEVASLVKKRINDPAMPMPPGALLPDNERTVLNTWLDQGHPQGKPEDASCVHTPEQPDVVDPGVPQADGTVCYTFQNHGQPMPGDASPYPVPPGEHYVSFYYTAPWKQEVELVNFRTIYDNQKVLHHWLLYSTVGSMMDGTFAPSIGTHVGDAAQLVAGWAVGGSDVRMPPDVGLRIPGPGAGLMIEWHFYNSDAAVLMDSSAIEACVVPAGTMKHKAGMTWLGTENFNGPLGMPPKSESVFSGTCVPSRSGMNETDSIKLFSVWPHMHGFGRNMQSVVTRADGSQEEVFNKPFDFNYQITYPLDVELRPGDVITSTCTFNNTSDVSVAFGPSSNQEMCYQFAYSYPAGALDNGVPSLVGASNTCW